MRTLQIRWTDEKEWKSLRQLAVGESEEDVLRHCDIMRLAINERYPHHRYTAEFRIVRET
jgi:hypothetical protein